VALQDVVKGVAMFEKLSVPIAGVIENMSYFVCPHCEQSTEIFGSGGGQRVSEKYGIPILGRVPLDVRIRKGGDEGRPVVVSAPGSPLAQAFSSAAEQLASRISVLAMDHEEEEKQANTQPIQFFAQPPSQRDRPDPS
jgi:ATP-binding protein involved in chromosome partitioning